MFEGLFNIVLDHAKKFFIQLLFSLSTRLTPSGVKMNRFYSVFSFFPGTNCP